MSVGKIWRSLQKGLREFVTPTREELSKLWQRLPAGRRELIRKSVVGGIVAAIALAGVAGLGIYALGWQNAFTYGVSRVVPFPAAIVDGRVVYYHAYAKEVRRLQPSATAGKALNQQALGKYVTAAVVENWAVRNSIKVSEAEVDKEVDKYLQSFDDKKQAHKALRENYGLSEADLRRDVRSYLLNQKVELALQKSNLKQESRDLAKDLLRQLKAGKDFDQLAKQYSQHPTAMQEGEAGLVAVASLPTEVSQAVAAASDGQLIDKVVAAQGSYYVIKRIRSEKVRLIVRQQVNFSQWLAAEHDKAKINKLLRQTR